MEAAATVIITSGNAMARNRGLNNNNLLQYRLPCFSLRVHRFTRSPIKALPSRHYDDDDMRSKLIKPDQKLEWSYTDSLSSHTTAATTNYHNECSSPPSYHHFHINDDLQGRMKAYRAKCHRQVLDKGVSMDRAFYREFAQYVRSVWLHKDLALTYYRKALTQMEMDASCISNVGGLMAEYAELLWKEFGNEEEANRVFETAVRDYPEDVQLLGSYAYFLWELSDNNQGF